MTLPDDSTAPNERHDGLTCAEADAAAKALHEGWKEAEAERDALQARVEELENIDRIGDLEDSLGRAFAEANQLAARVEELEAELAEAYRESREWQAERDRAAIYVPVGVDLSPDRKAGS